MIDNDIEQIDIDNREYNYSNKGIFITLKYYIECKDVIYDDAGVEFDNLDRLRYVCGILSYITDENLLLKTIYYLKQFGLLKTADAEFEKFKNDLISSYSDTDLTKIKAILYSLISLYEIFMRTINHPNSGEPLFDIKIKDRIIKHNLPSIINSIERKGTLLFVNGIETSPIKEQKDAISVWINNCLKLDYSNNTKTFTDSINFLNNLKDNLVQNKINISKSKHEPQQKPTKTILDFIYNIKNKNAFLDELKTTFPTEKGKSIKIIIALLEKESILIIGSQEFKVFHGELTTSFNRNLGTRQSINDVKFEDIHQPTIDPIQKKLNPLINKHKTK